ncbi:UPF0711 protein C18orf21 homolog isoform X2 [Megalops cyprinoides]|uniref:UPF0711 protein C18orf21 homolog isoform X2 n=1 Tax=Megalops cyprinoides TaxID=118141 RepID=UPI001864EBE0|nr:UPF0711 protein C18orf21 homolog isoform X2 [Megalops cyprinoides]
MATFVSLVTCHNCSKTSRRNAANRDYMLGYSKSYWVPSSACKHRTAGLGWTLQPGNRGRSPLAKFAAGQNSRSALPSTGSMKKSALGHLRKFLLFGNEQKRGRGGLKFFLPAL